MTEFTPIVIAMKYGFAGVLFCTGLYGLFEIFRTKRTVRAFITLPAALSMILLGISGALLVADHERYYDFLNLVKILSGIFTLVYGVYATLNDFYQMDETGRRSLTKVGLVGILLFFSSTLLSISADYVKNSIEKQAIEERRKYYASIVDKLVVVDKSTGKLSIDFQKFTENLFRDLKSAQEDLFNTRRTLAEREGRITALEAQLADSAKALRREEKQLLLLQGELGATREKLATASEMARSTRVSLDEQNQKLEKAENLLAERRAEVRELRRAAKQTEDALKARENELAGANREALRLGQEAASFRSELESARKRLDQLSTAEQRLGRSEGELASARKQLEDTENRAQKSEAELGRVRRSLDQKLGELSGLHRELLKAQQSLAAAQKEMADTLARLRGPAPARPGSSKEE